MIIYTYYKKILGEEMKTKLTLTLDNTIIEKAKIYAETNNSSISQMVSDYFAFIFTKQEPQKKIQKTPILSEISGILAGKNLNAEKIKKSYKKHLEEKYL